MRMLRAEHRRCEPVRIIDRKEERAINVMIEP